jgi:hypothetical protein
MTRPVAYLSEAEAKTKFFFRVGSFRQLFQLETDGRTGGGRLSSPVGHSRSAGATSTDGAAASARIGLHGAGQHRLGDQGRPKSHGAAAGAQPFRTDHPVEHEHDGCRRHVSAVAEYCA